MWFLGSRTGTYPPPTPFSGVYWDNPYENVRTFQNGNGKWLRCNFHTHTNRWGGLTLHRKNTQEQVLAAYDSLGYDVLGLSDYQHISIPTPRYAASGMLLLPCYEHGYSLKKVHQLSIGAREVTGWDNPFWQTLAQKQRNLNRLGPRTEVVALCHPNWHNAYTSRDIKYLTGYHLFEVMNDWWKSEALWDVALSAGKRAMAIGSDDTHNVRKPTDLARDLTLVYLADSVPTLAPARSERLYRALKTGTAVTVETPRRMGKATTAQKRQYLDGLPLLESFRVHGDSLSVALTGYAVSFSFIGQNGAVLEQVTGKGICRASYALQPSDTYVRVKISLADSTQIYLNPVMRTEKIVSLPR